MNLAAGARPVLVLAFALAGLSMPHAVQKPTVALLAPAAHSTVDGPDLEVRVRATGVELGSRGRNGAHVLLQLDQLPAMKSYAEQFTFRGVAPGPHRLQAELRRPDGGAFEPPVTATVEFTVRAPTDTTS